MAEPTPVATPAVAPPTAAAMPFILLTVLIDTVAIGLIIPVSQLSWVASRVRRPTTRWGTAW